MRKKVFVSVYAHFDTEGEITPLSLIYSDGFEYEIDGVLDKCRAASLKGGGIGMRYTIRIKNNITYLYYENPRWFVEGKS